MSSTWGSHEFNIYHNTFKPPHLQSEEGGFVQIQILPRSGDTNAQSLLQQMGRMRRILSFHGYVTSWAEYESLYQSFSAGEINLFVDTELGLEFRSVIYTLGEPALYRNDFINYTIEFMEA